MPNDRTTSTTNVLLTGATGFLGTTLLERLLRDESATVWALVRDRDGIPAERRMDSLLHGPAFGPLRDALGPDAARFLRRRVHVLTGDLLALRPGTADQVKLPANLDAVLHTAADVRVDAPLRPALATNVSGTAALYAALAEGGHDPHVIQISTSYVQAGRTELAFEAPVAHDVSWRRELGVPAVDPFLAADPYRSRKHVRDLGWNDTFTYSKALGERAAEELWAQRGHRLSIVRSALVESAWRSPYPGWLDGFKVADPLISAYAHGRLLDFPGSPDALIDIIPLDAVTDTVSAALALPARPGRARYLQVSTSTTAPLHLGALQRHIDAALADLGRPHDTPEAPRPMRYRKPLTFRVGVAGARARLAVAERLRRGDASRAKRLAGLDQIERYLHVYGDYLTHRPAVNAAATNVLLAEYRAEGGNALDLMGFDWDTYFRSVHIPALGRSRNWWPDATAPLKTSGMFNPGRPQGSLRAPDGTRWTADHIPSDALT